MMTKATHLVFYDGKCGLCDHFVQFLLKRDKRNIFVFAPLQGETAKKFLEDVSEEVKNADSVILVENFQADDSKTYIFGKAAFKILWHLGGLWAVFGSINFMPSFFYDWGYRLIASKRTLFFSNNTCVIPPKNLQDKFLK
ncbi:MAG: DUF393 domain-containing protein [Chlamydiota bacterium]|nr:DUF393 domain-containing protein [Chlamydiota bacterium]